MTTPTRARASMGVVIVVIVLGACRTTPAANPERSPETPEVWLESTAPTEPEGERVPGRPLSAAELSTLYECWFAQPYEFMFGAGTPRTVHVGGGEWGRFTAGVKGIIDYGSLAGCFGQMTGVGDRPFGDHQAFADFSGIAVLAASESAERPFAFYDPAIVRWGHTYLVPEPDARLGNHTTLEVYEVVFSRWFRLMAESYAALQHMDYPAEQRAYLAMANEKTTDAIPWLEQRYGNALPGHPYGGANDGTQWTVSMSFGFWLRRGIDGTHAELWIGLKKLLSRYDKAFLEQLSRKYERADFSTAGGKSSR